MIPDPKTAYEIYTQAGVAGLFLALYLSTVWMLIKELKSQTVNVTGLTREVVSALQSSRDSQERIKESCDDMVKATTDCKSKQAELGAWLRGRVGEM